ncbi:MAG: hypothetical protein HS128_09720 [Ideonella sp.]|nr:hypothetical protein [Ideonella sp.]
MVVLAVESAGVDVEGVACEVVDGEVAVCEVDVDSEVLDVRGERNLLRSTDTSCDVEPIPASIADKSTDDGTSSEVPPQADISTAEIAAGTSLVRGLDRYHSTDMDGSLDLVEPGALLLANQIPMERVSEPFVLRL